MKKVLTIAIPTYNRAKFLDVCLESINTQMTPSLGKDIEILIFDNNSTDETTSIVNKYEKMGLILNYTKNETNIGPDLNIMNCLFHASSKYVQVLGDDDSWVYGSLLKIVEILKNEEYGIVHLRSTNNEKEIDISSLQLTEFTNYNSFLKNISYLITFISANIMNREMIVEGFEGSKYNKSYMLQIHWYLTAVVKSRKNLIVSTPIIRATDDNSGGYSLFKVFAENFYNIYNTFVPHQVNNATLKKINRDLLTQFFPNLIQKMYNSKTYDSFEESRNQSLTFLDDIYRNNIFYRFYTRLFFDPKMNILKKVYLRMFSITIIRLPRKLFKK